MTFLLKKSARFKNVSLVLISLIGSHSLAFAQLPKELRAPEISVDALFGEILVMNTESETYQGWTPVGLGDLIECSRKPKIRNNLSNINLKSIWVQLPRFNDKPILFEKEKDQTGFFSAIHQEIAIDSSYMTYKYTFFPNAVMEIESKESSCEPISFFLIKKVRSPLLKNQKGILPDSNAWAHYLQQNLKKNELYFRGEKALSHDPVQGEALLLESARFEQATDAHFMLGWIYYHGMSTEKSRVSQDLQKARTYFQRAAELGHTHALRMIGKMQRLGQGGARDFKAAFQSFSTAAQAGNLEASVEKAEMKFSGEGIKKDEQKALEMLKKLVPQDTTGLVEWRLGCFHAWMSHLSTAEVHFSKSAALGFRDAYFELGLIRHNEAHYKEAQGYFRHALSEGYPVEEKLGEDLFHLYGLRPTLTNQ